MGRRPKLQFSLRTLLLIPTAVAVLLVFGHAILSIAVAVLLLVMVYCVFLFPPLALLGVLIGAE